MQHGLVVVAFEQQRMNTAQSTHDDVAAIAGICQQPCAAIAIGKHKLQRLGCIVRHRVRIDRQRPEFNTHAGANSMQLDAGVFKSRRSRGPARAIDRNPRFAREARDAARVVRMFVRHNDGVDVAQRQSGAPKSAA